MDNDKKFIAYFDYLGFKEFILNNDLEYQKRIMNNNFRDIESAIGQDKLKETKYGIVADLENSKINCINFSDTVVFWTNDSTNNSLIELFNVAYKFNLQAINYFFPVRGCIVFGEIEYIEYRQKNFVGGLYNITSTFGKGLITAYSKAEKQHWAGTVIDESVIQELESRQIDVEVFMKPFAKKYKVPYNSKGLLEFQEEYVLKIIEGKMNREYFNNLSKYIRDNFAEHNKNVNDPRVQEKIENTIHFLRSFLNDI